MANILITACYDLNDKEGLDKKRLLIFNKYRQLTDLCIRSFRKNLKDLDEVIVLEGLAENYHRMFQDIYYRIKKIYQAGDCNILWVDSDSVCIKPTEIFGKYDKFVMFDIQNQFCSYSHKVEPKLYYHLKPWMMSNVRYYPVGAITNEMWETGDKIASDWKDVWAYECIIYNTLFHMQGMSPEEIREKIYDPRLNFQDIGGHNSTNPSISLHHNGPHIMHIHGSRNVDAAIKAMTTYLKNAGIS